MTEILFILIVLALILGAATHYAAGDRFTGAPHRLPKAHA
jgi:hypothetical protein